MIADIHDTETSDAGATVRLRADRFALMFAALGYTDDKEIAALAGYSHRTIRRARKGQLGEVFIANTIHALCRHSEELAKYGLEPTFDELFEVVEKPVARHG